MAAGFSTQLTTLLRRNLLLKYRRKLRTVGEVIFPMLLAFALMGYRVGVDQATFPIQENPIGAAPLYPQYQPTRFFPQVLCVAPDNDITREIIKSVGLFLKEKFPVSQTLTYRWYNSTVQMEKDMKQNSKNITSIEAGVFFEGNPYDNGTYTLLFNTKYVPSAQNNYQASDSCRDVTKGLTDLSVTSCPAIGYYTSGFSLIQAAIDTVLLQSWSARNVSVPQATLKLFPKPAYQGNNALWETLVPLYMVLAFSPMVSILIMSIVLEKEKKIKEGMLMMGLEPSVYWLSWLLVEGLLIFVISVVLTAVLVVIGVMKNTNPVILFLVMFLYGLSLIMVSFMLSPFFSQHKTAGSVATLLVTFFSLFYMLAVYIKSSVNPAIFYLLSLLSPTAYSLALQQMSLMEITSGVNFQNLFQGSFSLGSALIMLLVDIVLYGLLAFYFDSVIPGEFGQRQKPYFFLLPSYWSRGRKSTKLNIDLDNEGAIEYGSLNTDNADVEPVTTGGRKEVIKINNLRKVFASNKKGAVVAVDGLTFSIYEGQITALLGHNGAGKTTLVNMLVGMLPPTSGAASMFGFDITRTEDVSELRKMIGVCLQENILLDELNAEEHLTVFARLKGVPELRIKEVVYQTIMDIDLGTNATVPSSTLSGGQKRKLCVGIALIGDPKLVFLDEPSSGLDPFSRHHLWSLLSSRKQDRVIILTTHFMDEADVLADRKVIISRGKLRCAGSSLFLKNRFGVGYHLTLDITDSAEKSAIERLVCQQVSTATCSRDTASELAFILPMSDSEHFSKLFEEIENSISSGVMGIKSYGVSMTTLEEVFLNLESSYDGSAPNEPDDESAMNIGAVNTGQPNPEDLWNYEVHPTLFSKFIGFFKLRMLLFLRDWRHAFPIIFMPVLILMVTYAISNAMQNTSSKQFVTLSSDLYSPPTLQLKNDSGSTLEALTSALNSLNIGVELRSNMTLEGMTPGYMAIETNGTVLDILNQQKLWSWLFNDSCTHSLPVMQNLISNALVLITSPTQSSKSLQVTSRPYWVDDFKSATDPAMFIWVAVVSSMLSFLPSLITAEVVEDRERKLKNQLRVSGLNATVYWATTLLVHSAFFLVSMLILIIPLAASNVQFLSIPCAGGAFALILILYIPTTILVCYVLTHIFDKHDTAKSFLPNICSMGSLIAYLPVVILDATGNTGTAHLIHVIMCFVFPFYIPYGTLYFLSKLSIMWRLQQMTGGVITAPGCFEWSSNLSPAYFAMVTDIILFAILLLVVDVAKDGGRIVDVFYRNRFGGDIKQGVPDLPDAEDDDVRAERARIQQLGLMTTEELPVVVDSLRKEYRHWLRREKPKLAVRNLTFSVDAGNIFGLLGPNGAGKTTSIKVMVAEESATCGKVIVGGYNISSSLSEAFQQLGYCPQEDTLWNIITPREHLHLYARIRGIAPFEIPKMCDNIIHGLKISEHADKQVKELSGGTKRKLCYAISMVGHPRIVFLDEPSTGMDPQSRRYMWNMIASAVPPDGQHGALLTTHSMEEADALCTRVGIMVKGILRCIGSTQHLKNKYGAGYTLDIKLAENLSHDKTIADVRAFVTRLFPRAIQKTSISNRLTYSVSQQEVPPLSKVFAALESGKQTLPIEEYSFSQTTLEQVFLGFAKEQEEEKE